MGGKDLDISALIERRPLGPKQVLLVVLCLAVVTLDGFDAQVMGYAAPSLISSFGISRSALGPVISSGLVGLMVGALVLGTLADRIGRKTVVLISTGVFGVFSLATAMAQTPEQMLMLRLLTGIGLGGAMPGAIALVSEYVPSRLKASLVTVTVTGFAIGPAAGGHLAPELIHAYGWPALFVLGGILPLLLLPVLWLLLPESSRFLVARDKPIAAVVRNLKRVLSDADLPADVTYRHAEGAMPKAPVREVFADGRKVSTLLLWGAIFFNLVGINLQTAWLPVMITGLGFPLADAVRATAGFHVGGAIGGLVLSRLLDRFDSLRVTAAVFGMAAVTIAAVGWFGTSLGALQATIFLAGLFVVGGQSALNAMSGILYPARIRSTGSGWALGMGRFGAAVGPLAGAGLASLHLQTSTLFYVEGIPFVLCACCVLAVRKTRPSPDVRILQPLGGDVLVGATVPE